MNSKGTVALRVELPPYLTHLVQDARRHDELKDALQDEIQGLAATLGVPGGVVVKVVAGTTLQRAGAINGIRVQVGATRCRFTQEQVRRVYALARDDMLAHATDEEIAGWLQSQDTAAVRFVALLTREAVARDPAVLLGPAQVDDVAAAIDAPTGQYQALAVVLREVLSLGISIGELAEYPGLIALLKGSVLPASAATESLIAALKPATVDIRLAPAELRRVTIAAGDEESELFVTLRDKLFYELGLMLPDFRFVEDASLAPRSFAFTLNSASCLPWVGLAPGELLVNDTAENVASKFRIPARAAANPNTGISFAVVESVPSESALVTWTALEYLVLCLATELRRHPPRLLDQTYVVRELDRLAESFPALTRCARGRYSDPQLVQILRELTAEGLSMRDLRGLLTTLVDFDTIMTDPSAYIVVDDRLPVHQAPSDPPPNQLLIAAIRRGQKRSITHTHTGGTGNLSALLLDPALEREIHDRHERGALFADTHWCDRVLDAIAAAVPAWGETNRPPCLLTTVDVRSALRRLVALEIPHVPVLCYDELASDCSISVLNRVQLVEEQNVHL